MPPKKRAAASVPVSAEKDQAAQNVRCPASSESLLLIASQPVDTASKSAQSTVGADGANDDSQTAKKEKLGQQRPRVNDV